MSTKDLTRQDILAQVNSILSRPTLTKADSARVSGLLQLSEQLNPAIGELRRMRLADQAASMAETDPAHAKLYRQVDGLRGSSQVELDFDTIIRRGIEHVDVERRALSTSGTAGGYLTPQQFSNTLYATMAAYDPMLNPNLVTMIETDTGSDYQVPILGDATASASKVAENEIFTPTSDMPFGFVNLSDTDKWVADLILVSRELVADMHWDAADWLAKAFGVRIARGLGSYLLHRLLGAATLGKTTASASAITYDEILEFMSALDVAYLSSPKCAWLMNWSTLIYLFKIKASTGGSPMLDLIGDNGQFYLFGKPLYIAPSLNSIGASAKTILLGAMDRYIVRTVRDSVTLGVSFEKYAEYAQVAYWAYLRAGADLATGGGSDAPVIYLQQHS